MLLISTGDANAGYRTDAGYRTGVVLSLVVLIIAWPSSKPWKIIVYAKVFNH